MIRHRLVAPDGLAPTTIELGGGVQLQIPPSGIVEIPQGVTIPGDPGIFEPVDRQFEPGWIRELLALGFRHTPPTGVTSDRPRAGRYPGEMFFDQTLGRPLWWSGDAWRTADGVAV